MISFKEFRVKNFNEEDSAPQSPAPDQSAASSPVQPEDNKPLSNDLVARFNADIENEINTAFDFLKRSLYNKVVPNRPGTSFLSRLRDKWWNFWYGQPHQG